LGTQDASLIIGRPVAALIHPDDRDVVAAGLRSLSEQGSAVAVRMVSLDGRSIDVELTVLPFGALGDNSFMIEAHDISDVKHAAEELHDREQRLQGILDTVGEGIITADDRALIQTFNPAAARIFGYTAEEVIGRNLKELMPVPYHAEHDGYLTNYQHTGQGKILGIGREALGRRKDGSVFPLDINVAELRRGEQRLFIGIVRDITERKRVEEALRQARYELEARVEERTRDLQRLSRQNDQILNSASEGIMGLDVAGLITFVNPSAAEMSGWRVEELIGRRAEDVLLHVPAAGEGGAYCQARQLSDGARETTELTLWRRDGTNFPVEFALAPIEEAGLPVGAVVVFRDITDRKRTEEKLRLASAVFETTAEAIIVMDPSFRVTTVNPAFTAITGYEAREVIGRPPPFLRSAPPDRDLHDEIWSSVRGVGRWDYEQWSNRKSGEEYAERLSVTATTDDAGRIGQYVVVFSDITQRKLDEERISYQANYDSLTELPNRALFMDRLAQALSGAERSAQRVGLMFLDLDGFKLVNDTLGHDIGDDLLQEAAVRLKDCVRTGDTVARLGGDEFTIIMPNLGDMRNAPIIAQRMIDALEKPFLLKTHEAFVSASIGIAAYPEDATDANSLLKNADAAMYRAKEQGKANYQFFTADLNAQVSERLLIKNGLSKALERGEFMLYYQPKCELATGRLTGVEALLRWRSKDMGMVSPVKFIPVMEETGLIGQVGEWALEVACNQHRLWRDAGYPHMRVAVNLSVRQLRAPDLPQTVEDILCRTGIDASGLELEITESMIMKDTENAVAVLRRLSDMGIHLAMDDFGTGYSSLSYLKLFPLHTIKIDRSFINDIATDPDDLEIIRTIISMGHSLRRRIVAEGVETEEQRVLLRKLRCDEMQGYLLSPPVPAAQIDAMLASLRHAAEV
ncbi:MAG TPA: PAS domain S-box protein, partial [Patescibacteria group bacterium]|nr:PAS domain S-box protein [Patescibacteria group bacterium]